jgi:peptidoglycan hydrolase-like protein with peptidoglycan-binding domain
VSRSGWFRRQQPLLVTSETSSSPAPAKSRRKRGAALTACGAALVFGAGIVIAAFAAPGSHASAVASVNRAATSNRVTPARPHGPAAALQLVSITPAGGAKGVNGASPIKVQFSAPLAASSPMPALSPQIAGKWTVQGDSAVFTPAVGYFEDTRVTVSIPSGPSGVKSVAGASAGAGGALSSAASKSSFTTGSFGHLGLQQLLAQLGYLPMTWTATSPAGTGPAATGPGNAQAALSAAYSAPAGTFSWQGSYPWNLTSQWKPGSGNMLEQGAIRAFQSVHGLTMDGTAGPSVWSALLTAAAKSQLNPNGYTYALATQRSPESLKIWHDGRLVFTSASNTGIPASPTADGTFPVYLRYYYQIMKGTNPDGSKYADPVYYVAYFNGGDAVHYFPRYSYGSYQSLGCVELPWDSAKKAWPYLTYGSLVTVTGPVA